MGIAICGMADRDLPKDKELWGMPWDNEWTQLDVLFDPHNIEDLTESHKERLKECWQPLYMQDNYYSHVTRYPIEDLLKISHGYEPSCTISYMIGFAIKHKRNMELHGITGAEGYESQRTNIEYMIGIARGMGLDVKVCGDSKLLTGERYGNWNGD